MPSDVLPVLDRGRCVRSRCNVTTCDACVVACPHDALDLSRPPRVDGDACTGCMICAAVCPADAVTPDAAELPLGLVARESDVLTVGCGARRGSRHDVTVPCLGAVGEAVLLTMALTSGAAVRFDATRCSTCTAVAGADALGAKLARTLQRAGPARQRDMKTVERTEDLPPPGRSHARRDFFRTVLAGAAGAVHDAALGPSADPHPRRRAPGTLQRQLATMVARAGADVESDLLFIPDVADHCTVCRCCAAVCPTEAVRRVKHEGRRRLEVDAARCTGCDACVEFCPEDAIEIVSCAAARTAATVPAI